MRSVQCASRSGAIPHFGIRRLMVPFLSPQFTSTWSIENRRAIGECSESKE